LAPIYKALPSALSDFNKSYEKDEEGVIGGRERE
jgi:hypothetical protein